MSSFSAGDAEDWAQLNQKLLNAELARLRHRFEGNVGGDLEHAQALDAAVDAARAAMPAPSALDVVTESFGLSPFERETLLLCCGVELDARVGDACARVNGDPAHRNATFSMALALLAEAHWSAVTSERPLRRWKLVEVEPGLRLVDSALRVDERILHFVAGINQIDPRLQPMLTRHTPSRLMASGHEALAGELCAALTTAQSAAPVIQLDGDDADAQLDVCATAALRHGLGTYVLHANDLPQSPVELARLQVLWQRESLLLPGIVVLRIEDQTSARLVAHVIEAAESPLIVVARDPVRARRRITSLTVDKPPAAERKQLWQQALGSDGAQLNGALDTLAGQFRLNARAIGDIAESTDVDRIWTACRGAGRDRLDDLAQRIEPKSSWDDLVLPAPQLATLQQIASHLRQRLRVYDEWGFGRHGARGLGISAMFCGESGTGKTLAAEVLASELRLDLYRIDLSSIVSKYIGETEKNLRRVFDAAGDSGALLLFDEADALFGKRSDVKDSHDRYANIEVSYLLQRMEAYDGLAVLTTNLKSAIDRAFQRRLRFIVNFPFPDGALREAIWRRSFPRQTPLGPIDYAKLARLSVPGGNIRNIALNAAFLAADADEPMAMSHLLRAAHDECAKIERPLSDGEIRGWV